MFFSYQDFINVFRTSSNLPDPGMCPLQSSLNSKVGAGIGFLQARNTQPLLFVQKFTAVHSLFILQPALHSSRFIYPVPTFGHWLSSHILSKDSSKSSFRIYFDYGWMSVSVKYRPSGTRGTRLPPSTPQLLQHLLILFFWSEHSFFTKKVVTEKKSQHGCSRWAPVPP